MKPKAYKSTILLAASTAARMLLALYTVKVTAVELGLTGTAVIGQFNNLLVIATTIAGGGIAPGIVNVVAKSDSPAHEVRAKLRSAHGYASACSALLLLLVLVCNARLANWLLPIEHGAALLIALAAGQFALFHIAALSAVVNSHGRQDLFAKSSLAAGAISAAAVTIGCLNFGLAGTLAGMLAGALSQWIVLFLLVHRSLPALSSLGWPRFVWADLSFWAHFSTLSLITVFGMPSAQIAVRNALATAAGWDTVGTWQAMVRLSDAYLQFGLLFLSSFYFPRLAAAHGASATMAVVLRYARVLVPAVIALCCAIYALRFNIVPLLFSSKFARVTDLFLPQLVGDVFKIASYLITYVFLAAGRYKLSMTAELAQAGLFWLLATRLGLQHGALGVACSYAATYVIYFLAIVFTFVVLLRRNRSREIQP